MTDKALRALVRDHNRYFGPEQIEDTAWISIILPVMFGLSLLLIFDAVVAYLPPMEEWSTLIPRTVLTLLVSGSVTMLSLLRTCYRCKFPTFWPGSSSVFVARGLHFFLCHRHSKELAEKLLVLRPDLSDVYQSGDAICIAMGLPSPPKPEQYDEWIKLGLVKPLPRTTVN